MRVASLEPLAAIVRVRLRLLSHLPLQRILQVVSQVLHIGTLLADNLGLSSATSRSHFFSLSTTGLRFVQRCAHSRHAQLIVVLANHVLQVVLTPFDFPFGHTPVIFVILLGDKAIYIFMRYRQCVGKLCISETRNVI